MKLAELQDCSIYCPSDEERKRIIELMYASDVGMALPFFGEWSKEPWIIYNYHFNHFMTDSEPIEVCGQYQSTDITE